MKDLRNGAREVLSARMLNKVGNGTGQAGKGKDFLWESQLDEDLLRQGVAGSCLFRSRG